MTGRIEHNYKIIGDCEAGEEVGNECVFFGVHKVESGTYCFFAAPFLEGEVVGEPIIVCEDCANRYGLEHA
ncbi:hypothetical protein [endosymbiont GvMRE of Glomus versiforme]|uniref:hypothetical protein n=1 Tax=endosymbiont GvMRE of Glomus versiforme TaxID=2039283 RepID=UPI000EDAACD0|nr:hypothetical protein [endosymbiont GvMRE of Glomus versiforme]RHZ36069.1 hypothetical protein GvMRE_Ic3g140 [endosymbiont GvMRE of Glomus versiforme]